MKMAAFMQCNAAGMISFSVLRKVSVVILRLSFEECITGLNELSHDVVAS